MTIEYRYLAPLDVLFMRGNRLFGDPGSFGEALIPPWPSLAAGALRSRMLIDDEIDPVEFALGLEEHPELGTPDRPGSFTLTGFHLARRMANGTVEALLPLPADLVAVSHPTGALEVRAMVPVLPDALHGITTSNPCSRLAVLPEPERAKPTAGYWLTGDGWRAYLAGRVPNGDRDLVATSELWHLDPRMGVGLDSATRRAADGRLFSTQAVALVQRGYRIGTDRNTKEVRHADYDVGFLTAVAGANPPTSGTVRFGADGRAAAVQVATTEMVEPDYAAIVSAGRCRLVLTAPGLFAHTPAMDGTTTVTIGPATADGAVATSRPTITSGTATTNVTEMPAGWLPTGTEVTADGSLRFELHGVRGQLVCAAVPRFEVISGWDLAQWQPKSAQRACPSGTVWWLDALEATPEALRKLAAEGLWRDPCDDPHRRAEGFNRVAIAAWSA